MIEANKLALRMSNDKHPHKRVRSREAIERTLENLRQFEGEGLVCQAALLLIELTKLHAFHGGNHRTALLVAVLFLERNGVSVQRFPPKEAFAFIKDIRRRTSEQVQDWIERYILNTRRN